MGYVPETVHRRKQLTRRQSQVVRLAASGMSDKEIARHLGLSRRTVEDHFIAARHRWDASTRAQLMAMGATPRAADRPPGSGDSGRVGGLGNDAAMPTFTVGSCSENQDFPNKAIGTEPSGTARPAPLKDLKDDARTRRPRRGRPTVMTPERIDAARELLLDHTISEVARKLGIGRTTFYAHLAAITRAV